MPYRKTLYLYENRENPWGPKAAIFSLFSEEPRRDNTSRGLGGTVRDRSNVSGAEEDMQYLPRHYFNLDRAEPYVRARTLRRRRYTYRLPPVSYQKQAA